MNGDPNYEPNYENYYQHWTEYDYYTDPKTVHNIRHSFLHPAAKYASYLEGPAAVAAAIAVPLLVRHSLRRVEGEEKEEQRAERRKALAKKEARTFAKTVENIDAEQRAAAQTIESEHYRDIRATRRELGEKRMLQRETEKFERESKKVPVITFGVPDRQVLRNYVYDRVNINKQARMIADKINRYGIDKFNEELAQRYDSDLVEMLTPTGMERAFFEGTYIPKPFRQFLSENVQAAVRKATRVVTPPISELKKNPVLYKQADAYKRQMPAAFAQQLAYREYLTQQRGGNMGFLNLPAKNSVDNIYKYKSFHA